jgi:hypothetical protein
MSLLHGTSPGVLAVTSEAAARLQAEPPLLRNVAKYFLAPGISYTCLWGARGLDQEVRDSLRIAYAQLARSLHVTLHAAARQASRGAVYASAYARLTPTRRRLHTGRDRVAYAGTYE